VETCRERKREAPGVGGAGWLAKRGAPTLPGSRAGQKRRKEPAALLFSLYVLPPFSLLGRILAMDL